MRFRLTPTSMSLDDLWTAINSNILRNLHCLTVNAFARWRRCRVTLASAVLSCWMHSCTFSLVWNYKLTGLTYDTLTVFVNCTFLVISWHKLISSWCNQRCFVEAARATSRSATTRLSEYRERLLPELQSAYRVFHSTETADILSALDRDDIALLDLSAAFDTVDHAILLKRMEISNGFKSILLGWFRSYLTHWS